MQAQAQKIKGYGLANLGGISFWDGPYGRDNGIIGYAKAGLS
jgi:hypothetical protein